MRSASHIGAFNRNDTVVQMARCSFDIHVEDIMGGLIVGATVVMLRPGGMLDFEYLTTVLGMKQVTRMDSVPSLLQRLFQFVEEHNRQSAMEYLIRLVAAGIYSFERNASLLQ